MNNKLMIAATVTALAGLFAPVFVFTAFADDAPIVQTASIDYRATDVFHSKFSIVEKGRPRIVFAAVRKHAGPFLDAYLQNLSAQNVDGLSKDAQLAYWLNVQNIVAIQAISFDTKKTNLKKLRGTGEAPGKLWTKPRFQYGSETLSLVDIENRIVGMSDDPNVLYGIYQGVRGGPRINKTAYQPATVRGTLAEAGQTYVNSRGIVKTDNQTALLTPVFDWHKNTLFGNDDTALIQHIRGHAYPRLANKLARANSVETVKLSYRTDFYQVPHQRGINSASAGSSISSGGLGSGFGS